MTKLEKLVHDEKKWELEKTLLQRRQALNAEKKNFLPKISTSKLLIAFLFLNCTLIEIFTGWVTVKSFTLAMMTGAIIDFTPLVSLIGAVVGEVIAFAIYALKSTRENTKGGIVYESAMKENVATDEPKG